MWIARRDKDVGNPDYVRDPYEELLEDLGPAGRDLDGLARIEALAAAYLPKEELRTRAAQGKELSGELDRGRLAESTRLENEYRVAMEDAKLIDGSLAAARAAGERVPETSKALTDAEDAAATLREKADAAKSVTKENDLSARKWAESAAGRGLGEAIAAARELKLRALERNPTHGTFQQESIEAWLSDGPRREIPDDAATTRELLRVAEAGSRLDCHVPRDAVPPEWETDLRGVPARDAELLRLRVERLAAWLKLQDPASVELRAEGLGETNVRELRATGLEVARLQQVREVRARQLAEVEAKAEAEQSRSGQAEGVDFLRREVAKVDAELEASQARLDALTNDPETCRRVAYAEANEFNRLRGREERAKYAQVETPESIVDEVGERPPPDQPELVGPWKRAVAGLERERVDALAARERGEPRERTDSKRSPELEAAVKDVRQLRGIDPPAATTAALELDHGGLG